MDKTDKKPQKKQNGGYRPGGGRPKGAPNKVNTEFRETIRKLLEDKAEDVHNWFDQVAQENPAKALDILAKLAEFAAPKLTRTEIAGDKENPIGLMNFKAEELSDDQLASFLKTDKAN